MHIDSGRITDPKTISCAEIAKACADREHLVVQFSRPEAYSPALLQNLNEACRLAERRLQVRFYGHYGSRFDATVLRHLPNVCDLAVDCLSNIDNEDEIGKLPKLERLSFGVFDLDRPDFLHSLNLEQLTELTLAENRKRNFDLTPLSRCHSLIDLFVSGHSKGIEAIAGLPLLRKLTLSAYAKSNSLNYLSTIRTLAQLTLILGGRPNLEDLESPSLEMLQVLQVRGLETLGNLSRLPALAALRVEAQLQITDLDLSGCNLERIWLFNCKNLKALQGLDKQDRLREFFAGRVALDLDALRDREWPASATSIQLFAGKLKWNDAAQAKLAAKGLNGKVSHWP